MARTLRRALNSRVFRNIGTMVSGSVGAQLIGMLATPLLTRLYGPDDFGALSMLTSAAAIIGVAATGRYEVGITVAKSRRDALSLALLAGCLAGATSVLLAIYALIAAILQLPPIGDLHHGIWAILLTFQVLTAAITSISSYWFTRQREAARQAVSHLLRSGAIGGSSIALGLVGFGGGLSIGQVLGQTASMFALLMPMLRAEGARLRVLFQKQELLRVGKRFQEFPKYSVAQGVTNAAAEGAMIWGLSLAFNPAMAGQYSLAYRICRLPFSVIGQAVRIALFRDLADAHQSGRSFLLAVKFTVGLLVVGAIPLMVLAVWGEPLFIWAFGPEWEPAGRYSRLLTPWLLLAFVNVPAVTLIPIMGLQKFHAQFEIVYVLTRGLGLLIGIASRNADLTILLYVLIGVAFNFYLIWTVLVKARLANQGFRKA